MVFQTNSAIGLKAWSGSVSGMPDAHMHADLELNLPVSADMGYLVQGQWRVIPAGHLGVIWGAVPHMSAMREPVALMRWVTVPMTTVWGWGLPRGLMDRLLRTGMIVDPVKLTTDDEMLDRWGADLENGGDVGRGVVLLEIEARLRRVAMHVSRGADELLNEASPQDQIAGLGSLTSVATMARHIVEHSHEEVSVDEIADAAAVSPGYAMTLFKKHAGMTLIAYLTRQRIANAQRLLVTTDRAVLDIALSCGFGSTSRFYEAFHEHAGCTPTQYRKGMGEVMSEE